MSEDMQSASVEIWQTKYQLKDRSGAPLEETIDDTFKRVAKGLASVEPISPEKKEEEFLWALRNGAVPAGRILSNIGAEEYKPNTSTINCTVSATVVDSMLGIMDTVKEAGLTLAAGCGIGYDFSTLRPRGAFVAGVGAQTSGVLSFMNIYDSMCFTVASAGGRRGAQMATMDISHPDVLDFIKAKREDGRLRQFNMSLLITDRFMKAVKEGLDWEFVFPLNRKEEGVFDTRDLPHPYVGDNMIPTETGVLHKVYGKMPARELWDIIMKSTYDYAEPGFILIDKVNQENNLWFCENIRTTNPCVPGDTFVLTDGGYARIRDLVGEEVRIWNGMEFSEVSPYLSGIDRELVEVSLSDGSSLKCTPNHNWVVKGGEKVAAANLKVGDKLEKYGYPVIKSGNTPEVDPYTQGVFSGDGCLNSAKDSCEIWLYGEKQALSEHLSHVSSWTDASRGDRTLLRVSGKVVENKEYVPLHWNCEARLSWLAGLIDSDGCVNDEGGSIAVSSVSKEFLLNVKLMLTTLGCKSSVALMKGAEDKSMPDGKGGLSEYSCKDCYRLVISSFYVKALLDLGLSLKRVEVSPSPDRNASRFVTVTRIEPAGIEKEVFCFTEPKNGTGTFNGIVTGQCGEQPLPPYGACLLGSINLTKLVEKPFQSDCQFNWDKFKKLVRIFTNMLDNVVEMHGLPLPAQAEEIKRKRRHGMGFFGLGSAMAMLRMKYGSPESLAFASKVSQILAVEGWVEGVNLAIKKGPAPIMEEVFEDHASNPMGYSGKALFAESTYLKRVLPTGVLEDIYKYGARFTHHTSIAPTGTISLSIGNNCSNGIEPSFNHEYVRNVIKQGRSTKEQVKVYSHEAWLWNKMFPGQPYPDYFCTAETISPEDHVAVQAAVQPWIDSSISKTVNVPTDIDFERFKGLYLHAYESGLKGCTTFRFNPEAFQGVLVNEKDLANTVYQFTTESGEVVELRGDEQVEYDGHVHTAANLFDALKEGYYGKL